MDPKDIKSLKCPNCGANIAEDSVRCDFCHAVVSVTACPSCFGPVFKGMKHCPACGVEIERAEADEDLKRKCPRCDQPLTLAEVGGVQLHECGACGGFWIAAEAFHRICESKEEQERVLLTPSQVKAAERDVEKAQKRFYVPCPECGNLMGQKNYAGCSGVMIDLCPDHGIWLDRQELQKIISFIRDGGLQKARQMELDKIREERKLYEEQQRAYFSSEVWAPKPVEPEISIKEDPVVKAVVSIVRYARNWLKE